LKEKAGILQSENEQLKSEQKLAGEQLQNFCRKFFDSVNSIPPHVMHSGLSSSSTLNSITLSKRSSGSSISSMTSQ